MDPSYLNTAYRFLPWVRHGLAAAHTLPDPLNAPLAAHPGIAIGVRIAQNPGNPVPVQMRSFGAGDVIGIDTRLIVRTEPRPQVHDFEANFLACIDFDPPDFPWAFTPAAADEHGRLRPWLVLLVLETAKVALPRIQAPALLPVIQVKAADAASELPDLAQSWSWAHAQMVSNTAINNPGGLAADLARDPRLNISRLISPRRLKSNTAYFACLVPAFKAGALRGLGMIADGEAGPDTLEPAWPGDANAEVKLPVYFHWEFSTGAAGDFEYLARRLRTPPMVENDKAIQAALAQLGTVPVALDADHLLTRDPLDALMEGALVNLNYKRVSLPDKDVADNLAAIVNAPNAQVANPVDPAVADQRLDVKPPIYGAWHAKRHHLASADLDRDWLTDLNLDPRYRAAAGYGTEIVKRDQEEFVEASLKQLGDVLATEALLNRGRLAREALRVLHTRHLAALPPERFLQITAPLHTRVMLDQSGLTIKGNVAASSFPDAATDPAMRRFSSSRRPVLRNAARRAGMSAQLGSTMQSWVNTLSNASKNTARLDINAFVPDGLLGSRGLERLDLPAADEARVDLSPLGWSGSLTAGVIRSQIKTNHLLQQNFATGKRVQLHPKDVRRGGVLTDMHLQRLAQFSSAAAVTPSMNTLTEAMRERSTRGVEGLLLRQSASGVTRVDSLRIDNRGGLLQLDAVRGQARMLARIPALVSTSALARVAVGDARKLGAQAVFASLPLNTLDTARKTPINLQASADFRFGEGAAARTGSCEVSITLPPPYKSRAVVSRYAAAYKNIAAEWVSPAQRAGVGIAALDLPLARIQAQVLARTQPDLSVTARLNSMLSISGERLDTPSQLRVGDTLWRDAQSRQRYIIPRTFDRVMAYPRLDIPLYQRLASYDKRAFLPGVDDIPDDLILLLRTNASFIDSFMVGANVEMNRELLWRAYPTDQRGTPFHHFWQRFDPQEDIQDIHMWNREALGERTDPRYPERTNGKDFLVLLVRGQLLKRYPNTHVYAWKKGRDETSGKKHVLLKNTDGVPPSAADIREPVFAGVLGNDIVFFGFDIKPAKQKAGEWCFVLEEPMTEPRFGFDIEDGNPNRRARPLLSSIRSNQALLADTGISPWKALSWGHLDVAEGSHVGLAQLGNLVNSPFPGATDLPANPSSADFAHALIQLPFRAFYLGNDLIP